MRKLTFGGFLRQYLCTLSGSKSLSIRKLSRMAVQEAPRLREPLFLYALCGGKAGLLLQTVHGTKLEPEYRLLSENYSADTMLFALQSKDSALPPGYHKVWRSYCSVAQRKQTDNQTKALMRERVLTLQKECCVTNYRLYTDLHLNPSNLNAWLKHGDPAKISLNSARRVMNYLQEQAASASS